MALKNLAHAALLALALGAAGAAAQTQAFDPQSEKAGTSCIGYRFTVADSGMKSAQPINASVAFDQVRAGSPRGEKGGGRRAAPRRCCVC